MLEGLPPNDATHVMRLRCPEEVARRVADAIVETFDPADTAAAAFEDDPSASTWAQASSTKATWIVEVFFGRAPDEDAVRELLAAAIDPEVAASVEFAKVAPRDWVAASLAGLTAVREGRFVLYGAHARENVRPGDIGIEIEAALAFGTGHHGTTRGCLEAMNALGRRRRPRRILDVGTGTGVLAIAAARRFHRKVRAGDIDAVAVATARDNIHRNGVAPWVGVVRAAGITPALVGVAGPFDLVLCNILARPLRAMAPAIRAIMAPGGELILSGLLGGDVPGVVSAYRRQGLVLTRRRSLDGWATLGMRRPTGLRSEPECGLSSS